jgi:hypothetical protein
MQYSTVAGEHVLDLFGGSGSTLIGAERTGRKAFLMELDPLYCGSRPFSTRSVKCAERCLCSVLDVGLGNRAGGGRSVREAVQPLGTGRTRSRIEPSGGLSPSFRASFAKQLWAACDHRRTSSTTLASV